MMPELLSQAAGGFQSCLVLYPTHQRSTIVLLLPENFKKHSSCESDHPAWAQCLIYSELVRNSQSKIFGCYSTLNKENLTKIVRRDRTICLMAISIELLERFLPYPRLLKAELDFPDPRPPFSVSRGGPSFLMFTTLSTILLPIATGLKLSQPLPPLLAFARPRTPVRLPLVFPIGARPLDGEQDCLLAFPLPPLVGPPPRSMEPDLEPGAEATPGLPLEAETGLSAKVVLRFGGASKEKPGISGGFHGLDEFKVGEGEVPRDGALLNEFTVGEGEVPRDGALLETIDGPVGVEGLRVGVAGLDTGFFEDAEDGRGLDRVGVADLAEPLEVVVVRGAAVDVVARAAVKVAREVGVEDLEFEALVVTGLDVEVVGVVDLLVGVAGLLVDLELPEEDGLLSPATEEELVWGLLLFPETISSRQFPSCRTQHKSFNAYQDKEIT